MTTPFHVYLDLDVRNDDVETATSPPPLNFDETRLQPFLMGDASDYFCTIARFTLDTSNSIPVFIPEIDTTQNNPYRTIYKITFVKITDSSGANLPVPTVIPANVIYDPTDLTTKTPTFPFRYDPSDTFYHVHSY